MKTTTHNASTSTGKAGPDADLHEQIKKRAHEIWLTKGGGHGDNIAHWLQAENEALARLLEISRQTSVDMRHRSSMSTEFDRKPMGVNSKRT
jgi:hypothetical protein